MISSTVFILAWIAYGIQASFNPEFLAGTQPLLSTILTGLTVVSCLVEIGYAYMYYDCLKKFRQVMTNFVDDRKDAMHARGIQLQFLYESRYSEGSAMPSGPDSTKPMHYVQYKLYQWLQLDVIQPV